MQNTLAWWEPAWSYGPELRKEAIRLIRAFPTVLGITAAIALLFVFLCKRYLPSLQFDWLRALAISVGAITAYLGLFLTAHWFIPPRVNITAKRVGFTRGSKSIVWRFDCIHSARIIEVEPGRFKLVIQSVAGRKQQCGIPSHVSPDDLRRMFGAKWNAAPLPPNTTNKEFAAAMFPWAVAMSVFILVLIFGLVVTRIMGVSGTLIKAAWWVMIAVVGAMLAMFFIKAYKFDRARRSAQKKVGQPET